MQNDLVQKLSTDLHPPLTPQEALVESSRCYFCHDAPCVTACPTGIDVPLFIRQINTGNAQGAGETIFEQNIFGGMCARVCPTETLCEQECVRNLNEQKPVRIGELQRYATDSLMATGRQMARAESQKTLVAVVGAGPAGLACAHRLAVLGHQVTVFDALPKAGGLNEYGIASYKSVDNFAQREVQYILSVGGIEVQHGQRLGRDFSLKSLKDQFDAVFLGIGLAGVNRPDIDGMDSPQVENAVDFISRLRQCEDFTSLQIPRRVLVIGGGMTAIDAAVQARMLGAELVSIVYRRSQAEMNASEFEQQLAQTNGVFLRTGLQPVRLVQKGDQVVGVEFEYTRDDAGQLVGTGEQTTVECDLVLNATGQSLDTAVIDADLVMSGKRVQVDDQQRTSDVKIWAGGDCASSGEDLTVAAVQAGKVAAESMHTAIAVQS